MMRNRSIAWFLLAALAVVAGITLVHETIEAHHHLDGCHFCVSVGHWLPGDSSPSPLPTVRVVARHLEAAGTPTVLLLTSLSARAPPRSV